MATEISNKKLARIAGLLYLGVVVTGIFTLMYVPFKLFNADNASLIFQNITSSQTLLRLGIVGGLLCYTFFLFLPLVLYKLLKTVNENYAKLMVLLAVLSVPVFFLNVQNLFSILSLIISGQSKLGLSKDQIQLAVMQHLDQYDNGLRIVHIFSGLWLFPFGYLVFKSGFLPKLLGVLLMLGCFGYLINFIGNTLIHDYSKTGISSYISLPASFGEIGTCLWLLVIGVKDKK
ncbi:MAG: DUF4386 domain-containing protein [Chitinophagaceae bacterium]|nr:DUF4386 domain-containing protein [Chitinophagaceae bacterium]